MRAYGSFIVAHAMEEEQVGAIYIKGGQADCLQAKVVSVGPGRWLNDGSRAEIDVKEGDIIVCRLHAGTPVTVKMEEYIVLNEADILAVL